MDSKEAIFRTHSALSEGNTLAYLAEGELFTSTKKGISPLYELVGKVPAGAVFADLIVGKAAAMLYLLLRPAAVYGETMTKAAHSLLQAHGIDVSFGGELVPCIVNRAGTGLCPMEAAVEFLDEPSRAYEAIGRTLEALKSGSG